MRRVRFELVVHDGGDTIRKPPSCIEGDLVLPDGVDWLASQRGSIQHIGVSVDGQPTDVSLLSLPAVTGSLGALSRFAALPSMREMQDTIDEARRIVREEFGGDGERGATDGG